MMIHSHISQVFKWCGDSAPGRKPSCTYYNKDRDRLESYSSSSDQTVSLGDFSHFDGPPVVQTAEVKCVVDSIARLLDTNGPFMLAGPEGAGKSFLLGHCFTKMGRAVNVAVVHCSANITPQHVIQKLYQVKNHLPKSIINIYI